MKSTFLLCFFLLLISFGSTSCSKEKEYEIVLINDTSFKLDRVKIGCAEGIVFVEAPPQGGSNPFFVTIKNPALSTSEALLCISILKYSTPARFYDYNFGSVISIGSLEERRVNYIKVEENEDPGSSGLIFSIKLQE